MLLNNRINFKRPFLTVGLGSSLTDECETHVDAVNSGLMVVSISEKARAR